MKLASLARSLAAASLLTAASAAPADVYTVDFFPEGPQTSGFAQLRFVPSFVVSNFVGGEITETRLHITFTTGTDDFGQPFDAAGLTLLLAGAVENVPGFWFVTGADLGWFGQGTFTANLTTQDFNGVVAPGAWQFDLSGPFADPEILPYAGTFSDDTRIEITYRPAPEPCPADINQSGEVTVQDIFDFLGAYFAGEGPADFNQSGDITVQDIFDFLSAYFTGCQ